MPSSNKTSHLLLNRWLGGDKPKKDDFNADNQKIDDACAKLDQKIRAAETAGAATGEEVGNLGSRMDAMNGRCDELGLVYNNLNANFLTHWRDGLSHVSAADRDNWEGAGAMTMGTYLGNGGGTQSVNLGFPPKFGAVFPLDGHIISANWMANQVNMLMGFFSSSGCSKGIAVTDNGFRVNHVGAGSPDGYNTQFNNSGQTYVYVAWK